MRVATVTGSRADRAHLLPLIKALNTSWIVIDPNPSDTSLDTARATGYAVTETASKLERLNPDLVLLLGDRFEILGAATAANILSLPIAHLGGGDLTEGSQDDCFRHAITKLAHLHFTTNDVASQRLVQMGEDPLRVHMVGSLTVDRLMQTSLMTKEKALFGTEWEQFLLVCLHPDLQTTHTLAELSIALTTMRTDIGVVFIGPNADAGQGSIKAEFQRIAANRPNTIYCPELDSQRYISLMMHCDAMVGNSSAGIYEAPSFGTPVVNIGDRQAGRIKAPCVTDVEPESRDILAGVKWALKAGHFAPCNPYGDGHACERIIEVIKATEPRALLRKRFHHVGNGAAKADWRGDLNVHRQAGAAATMEAELAPILEWPGSAGMVY